MIIIIILIDTVSVSKCKLNDKNKKYTNYVMIQTKQKIHQEIDKTAATITTFLIKSFISIEANWCEY